MTVLQIITAAVFPLPCGGSGQHRTYSDRDHIAHNSDRAGGPNRKSADSSRYPGGAHFLMQRPGTDAPRKNRNGSAKAMILSRPARLAGLGAEKNAISSRFFRKNRRVCNGNARKARFHPDPYARLPCRPRTTLRTKARRHPDTDIFSTKNSMIFYIVI